MDAKLFRGGNTLVFKGEDLRLLGLEPSSKPSAAVEGTVTDVNPLTGAITVSWKAPTSSSDWRGVEGAGS